MKLAGARAVLLPSGDAMVVGGRAESGETSDRTFVFSAASSSWSRGPDLNWARADFGIARSDAGHATPSLHINFH